ncbi:MAG: response regulator [Oscillospiraceae bacterium]|nr:response regulator [Oscillospiraceae bacterium]
MGDSAKKTILIVDDVFSNQRALQSIFRNQYETIVAENGVQALQILESGRKIDLMLLDIHMPVMDGFEVLKRLGAEHLPVVIITSDDDTHTELKALRLGAQDLITKPFEPTLIAHRIGSILEKAEAASIVNEHRMLIHSIVTLDYDLVVTLNKQTGVCQMHNLADKFEQAAGVQDYEAFLACLTSTRVGEQTRSSVQTALSLATVRQALAGAGSYEYVFQMNRENETVTYKRAKYSEMADGVHLLMTITDITKLKLDEQKQQAELRKAYIQAQQANRAKTEFLSRMSHDFRTPLNAVIGFSNLAVEETKEPQTADYLQKISASGKYLLGLINDVLDMTKIDSGAMTLHFEPCLLTEFDYGIESVIRPIMDRNGIHFHYAMGCGATCVSTDKLRFNQIFFNLLSNAAKFTPVGGTVDFLAESLSKTATMHRVRFVVRDNGIGMSEKFQKRMFDAFSQESSTHISNEEGSGLGLSIVYHLVKLMGGTISCKSKLNEGTEFVVELDLTLAQPPQASAHLTPPRPQCLLGKRILLCEDHPLNKQIAVKLLEKQGMLVEHAANGQLGVERFAGTPEGYYDGILMDIRMPVMDGLEATKAIRALPRADSKTIPIIAMTANAFDEDIKVSFAAGMNAHLSKPINPQALYHCLEKCILDVAAPKNRKLKILVVDDVEVNLEVMRLALKDYYIVLCAYNGVQALDVISQNQDIAAVITDLQMPEMDGPALITAIRKEAKYKTVAILANTQYGDPQQEEEILSLGADDFVYKPTTPSIVRIRLANVLCKYRR